MILPSCLYLYKLSLFFVCFLMKPKIDLVNMFLVNTDGRAAVPVEKTRNTRRFTSVMLVEDTSMPKSDYGSEWIV